ncbi:MAG: SAM-dependent methyltransferase [Verrucomicrobiales bacterium]|nr:SAM-dependent methyltransferase [Verrucomicrobiales bacterium]
MNSDPLTEWLARLRQAIATGTLVKVTLGAPREATASLRNVYMRPVHLQAGPRLSFCYHHRTHDITKNLEAEPAVTRVAELLGSEFGSAHLFTTEAEFEWQWRAGGRPRFMRHDRAAQSQPSTAHDRARPRQIPVTAPWLEALGVTNAAGQVRAGMAGKHRQIHRFVEILGHNLASLPRPTEAPFRLVDMGCGKGYLTFAAFEWLRREGFAPLEVVGLEIRPHLVESANRLARELDLGGLQFRTGSIADAALERVEVLVALHACDTATDDALAQGIRADAKLLLTAPCCHKELRPQLQSPPVLAGALQHGIFLERQAEFVTDALRAGLLEWAGYDTRVFEFVSTEHTAKNLMIAAAKRALVRDPEPLARAVRELAGFYGIASQCLARHLGFELKPGPAAA